MGESRPLCGSRAWATDSRASPNAQTVPEASAPALWAQFGIGRPSGVTALGPGALRLRAKAGQGSRRLARRCRAARGATCSTGQPTPGRRELARCCRQARTAGSKNSSQIIMPIQAMVTAVGIGSMPSTSEMLVSGIVSQANARRPGQAATDQIHHVSVIGPSPTQARMATAPNGWSAISASPCGVSLAGKLAGTRAVPMAATAPRRPQVNVSLAGRLTDWSRAVIRPP